MPLDFWVTFFGWSMPEHTGISDDLDILLPALKPSYNKSLITLSSFGSGDAAIALAAHGAENVFALDIEDVDMLRHLISFKAAAGKLLSRNDYIVLMGLCPSIKKERYKLFDVVLKGLMNNEQKFWSRRRYWVSKGFYFANRQTFFLQIFWIFFKFLVNKEAINSILYDDCYQKRVMLFRQYVARPWLVKLFYIVGSHVNLFYPEAEWKNSEYPKIYNKNPFSYFEHLVERGISKNPLFSLYFQRGISGVNGDLLPCYMKNSIYPNLKKIDKIISILPSKKGVAFKIDLEDQSCDGAYLSNIIDYLDAEELKILFSEIVRISRRGSPVLVYSCESYDKVPVSLGLELDVNMSRQLKSLDRVCTYSRLGLYIVK